MTISPITKNVETAVETNVDKVDTDNKAEASPELAAKDEAPPTLAPKETDKQDEASPTLASKETESKDDAAPTLAPKETKDEAGPTLAPEEEAAPKLAAEDSANKGETPPTLAPKEDSASDLTDVANPKRQGDNLDGEPAPKKPSPEKKGEEVIPAKEPTAPEADKATVNEAGTAADGN